jgi:hypothetical protein
VRFVSGPMDGQDIETTSDRVEVEGTPGYYVRGDDCYVWRRRWVMVWA